MTQGTVFVRSASSAGLIKIPLLIVVFVVSHVTFVFNVFSVVTGVWFIQCNQSEKGYYISALKFSRPHIAISLLVRTG